MDNSEKLATYDTQDEDKTKQKHNTICVVYHYTPTNTNTKIRHELYYKQLEVKYESNLIFMRKS